MQRPAGIALDDGNGRIKMDVLLLQMVQIGMWWR
jgi:hypothetical protein